MGRSQTRRTPWGVAWLLVACSGGGTGTPQDAAVDAGVDAAEPDAASFAPAPPAPPAPTTLPSPAALPDFGACPPGWRSVGADPPTCDPWPEGGRRDDCAPDEAHLPGGAGCERIGRACPAGEWADDLPAGTLHVRAAAPEGGDGSADAPFATIADALAAVTPGTVVAIARGRYDEVVVSGVEVTLRGACAAETILAPSTPHDSEAAVQVTVAPLTLQDLRIEGERPGLHAWGESAAVTLQGVVLAGVTGYAVFAELGARVDGHDVAIRDVRGRPSDGAFGRALEVRTGAELVLGRLAVVRVRQAGLISWDPSSFLSLTDASISDVAGGAGGELGIGAIAGGGAAVVLERAILERSHTIGVIAGDIGTRVELTDVVIRDTGPEPATATMGRGVSVEARAVGTLSRVLVEGSHEIGMFVTLADVEARDLVVRGTVPQQLDGGEGSGVVLQVGGIARGARWLVDRNTRTGVRVRDPFSSLEVEDATIRDTQPSELEDGIGRGIEFGEGGAATLRRLVVERSIDAGIAIVSAGGLVLEDLVVRDTFAAPTEESGRGVSVWEGGSVRIARALLERNVDCGLIAAGPASEVVLEDVTVTDTAASPTTGAWGRGLSVQGQAVVSIARGNFARNREVGLLSAEAGTTLEIADVVVSDTLARETDGQAGLGIAAYEAGLLRARRVVVERSATTGIGAETGSTVELDDVVVRDTVGTGDGFFGRAIIVQGGSRVDGARLRLERNREVGLSCAQPGSRVRLEDIVISETLERECIDDGCVGAGGGAGAVAFLEGAIDLRRFLVTESALCGVQVARGGAMDLHEGEVSGNPIGANVQGGDYDLNRLMDGVVFHDNERNFDGTNLPVPDAVQ